MADRAAWPFFLSRCHFVAEGSFLNKSPWVCVFPQARTSPHTLPWPLGTGVSLAQQIAQLSHCARSPGLGGRMWSGRARLGPGAGGQFQADLCTVRHTHFCHPRRVGPCPGSGSSGITGLHGQGQHAASQFWWLGPLGWPGLRLEGRGRIPPAGSNLGGQERVRGAPAGWPELSLAPRSPACALPPGLALPSSCSARKPPSCTPACVSLGSPWALGRPAADRLKEAQRRGWGTWPAVSGPSTWSR